VSSPTVLALLGTDHHRFDRLVRWLDEWAAQHPDETVMVQYGSAGAPAVAQGQAFLDFDDLQELVRQARIVVCHGGPATISQARAAGHQPVVVPRDPALDEHVDDHQQRFSAWAAERGLVDRVTEQDELVGLLDARLLEDVRTTSDGTALGPTLAAERFGHLVAAAAKAPGMRPAGAPVVAYLAGFGRSGSTLLERLLGEAKSAACLGEVVHLWERGLKRDELCSCGEPFSACPQWQAIGRTAFGGWDKIDVERVIALHDAVDRHRRMPRTMLPFTSRALRGQLLEYAGYYNQIYCAAAEVCGVEVVIDSSKHVSLAFALSHRRDVDLRVLQVVRDPRAVVYSWSKDVARPEATPGEGEEQMAKYSTVRASLWWLVSNALVEALRLRRVPRTRVRYEDLVTRPEETLRAAVRALDLPLEPKLDRDGNDQVVLSRPHSVAGNPMRFHSGPITLRLDDKWHTELSPGRRRVATLLTWPLYRWYRRSEPDS
jgi:UDP-N-acetylglucosamine transferase subunit ALG13